MIRFPVLALALAAALPAATLSTPALAQSATPPALASGHTLLTVNAQGKAVREPDMATFSAGVTSEGRTASAALTANAARMNAVIAELKRSGIAARDIQTSNLSLSPVYGEQAAGRDGRAARPIITGYQASNRVTVRQRKLDAYGATIDALVAAGANEVDGPAFGIETPQAALDEARTMAIRTARERAELYARAAGLRVVGIVAISETGGAMPPQPMVRMAMMKAEASPVEAGELDLTAEVTVQFELAR